MIRGGSPPPPGDLADLPLRRGGFGVVPGAWMRLLGIRPPMFREFKGVRQEPGGRRRWFEAEDLELVLWLGARGEPAGFQLLYALPDGERALTWRRGRGFAHSRVDDGETRLTKMTPILVADGTVPWFEVETRFRQHAGSLEPGVAALVLAHLQRRR